MPKTVIARATILSGTCEMFWPTEIACFLCHVVVPANTPHRCSVAPAADTHVVEKATLRMRQRREKASH